MPAPRPSPASQLPGYPRMAPTPAPTSLRLSSAPARLEGHVLGGCRLVRRLSRGGMGEVYLGEQLRLGDRPVAVKVVRPEDVAASLPQPRDLASARDPAQRFIREGAVLGQPA